MTHFCYPPDIPLGLCLVRDWVGDADVTVRGVDDGLVVAPGRLYVHQATPGRSRRSSASEEVAHRDRPRGEALRDRVDGEHDPEQAEGLLAA